MNDRTEVPDRVPTRADVEAIPGPVVLEFGASWCPHCQALAPRLARILDRHPNVRHIWIEDGRGQPLGRSFRVKLWPTLVLLRDGQVLAQTSRPGDAELRDAFDVFAEPDQSATL